MSAPAGPSRNEFADVKRLANGRWEEILPALLGWPKDICDGRNRPCPRCQGRDRFRFTNYGGNGAVLCNQCAPDGIGDGFDAIAEFGGLEPAESVRLVAQWLRIATIGARPRAVKLTGRCNDATMGKADDLKRAIKRAEAAAAAVKFRSQLTDDRLAALAADTGVPQDAWGALGVGYCDGDDLLMHGVSGDENWRRAHPAEAWAIPESSASGTVVGFSCRSLGGAKGCPSGGLAASSSVLAFANPAMSGSSSKALRTSPPA